MPGILVVGAGIGGLTAALALARVGAAVTLVERSPSLEEIGAGLQLSPNAGRVLAGLGLTNAIAAAATRPAGIRVRSARSGRTLSFMPLSDAEARWGSPYCVIRRADLQAILLAAVRAEPAVALHLGATLVGFSTDAAGVEIAVERNGGPRTFAGEALIGADGVRSRVRATLVSRRDDAPRETGRTAWRALVPMDDVGAMFAAEETGLWLGHDAHLVHYTLPGRRLNVVAVTRDRDARAPDDIWSAPGDPHRIGDRFAGWPGVARGLIAAAPGWTTWPLYDRAPLPAWNVGRVALLGDAAHPILPFLAQGAAQAIEDAGVLAAALAGGGSIPDRLARYSHSRRARATLVQDTSRRLGRVYHLAGPMATARDATMHVLGPERLLARYDWLYGTRL